MRLLFKLMVYLTLALGLGYLGLYFIADTVEPEKREIIIPLPTPKPLP